MEARLIVEAGGPTHEDNAYDRERDARLRIAGYRVLRFKNSEIGSDTAKALDTIRIAAGR